MVADVTPSSDAPRLAPMAYAATPEPAVEKPRATAPVAAVATDRTASIPARVEKPVAQKPQETRAAKADSRPALPPGMMIQIGASDNPSKANALLAKARSHAANLKKAKPFTEKVQRGGETLYRARFAGLSERDAEAACKSLKRSGISCFTTRN
jgi:D-alanyl-D-alanine carboxypeptidase